MTGEAVNRCDYEPRYGAAIFGLNSRTGLV